ncbi:very long chain fatty acid elongase 4-like [Mytilus edulis]|uniref:very long chain fatty acid elongase 4-like n=1 Tax=Mytilus edulis TaxID=6550 RepID=UPI0039EF345B
MAVTILGVQKFVGLTISLQSFPLFCVYLLMILVCPLWQKVTSPIQDRTVLMFYNFTCSFISLYSLLGFLYCLTLSESTFELRPAPYLKPYFRLYWITKIIELLDTVFMILRHKQRQISFLHVYHHSSMLLLADACYHLYPWPAMATYLATNSFVHVILYMYYCLTASFPNKSFPWRKYITQLQILQFFVLFVHAAYGYLNHGFCIYGLFMALL